MTDRGKKHPEQPWPNPPGALVTSGAGKPRKVMGSPVADTLKIPITSMDGRAIEECLNMLNPTITVEAKGELISMIRELGQLRIMVEMAKNVERRRGYEDGPIAFLDRNEP